uniref:Uncharacterized protein n=1 Tax=viral metagenome TaxID=1070528 RepID=A0A6C0JQ67_9ZZZZ
MNPALVALIKEIKKLAIKIEDSDFESFNIEFDKFYDSFLNLLKSYIEKLNLRSGTQSVPNNDNDKYSKKTIEEILKIHESWFELKRGQVMLGQNIKPLVFKKELGRVLKMCSVLQLITIGNEKLEGFKKMKTEFLKEGFKFNIYTLKIGGTPVFNDDDGNLVEIGETNDKKETDVFVYVPEDMFTDSMAELAVNDVYEVIKNKK